MEKWSYIDYDTLIKSIIDGNRSIQDPITIYNDTGSQSKNTSFLNHIINYENVDSDNLIELLHTIFTELHGKVNELNNNTLVSNMVSRIMDEWFLEGEIMDDKPISYDFFDISLK